MHKGRLWGKFWVAGTIGSAAYLAAQWSLATAFLYPLFAAAGAAGVVIGIRVHRPPERAWYLIAAALGTFAVADVAWIAYSASAGVTPTFPSVVDALYLLAYAFFAAALVSFVRRRRAPKDWGGLVDAAIVSLGVALVAWPFLINPLLDSANQSVVHLLVSVLYPIIDSFVLVVAVQLFLTLGRRTPSDVLLFAGLALLFGADAYYYYETAAGMVVLSPWAQAAWTASYLMVGAAALHPTMSASCERSLESYPTLTPLRLAMLIVVSLLGPLVFFLQWTRDRSIEHLWVLVVGSVMMSLLIFLRLALGAARLRRALAALGIRTQALADSETRKAAILDSALDCSISADAEGRIIDFNAASELTFGFKQSEVMGKRLEETIIPPHLREAHRQGMQRYVYGGEGKVIGRRIEVTGFAVRWFPAPRGAGGHCYSPGRHPHLHSSCAGHLRPQVVREPIARGGGRVSRSGRAAPRCRLQRGDWRGRSMALR